MLFTYNEQDDISLHYLKTFEGKQIMAAENYLTETEEGTSQETAGKEGEPESGTEVSQQTDDVSRCLRPGSNAVLHMSRT